MKRAGAPERLSPSQLAAYGALGLPLAAAALPVYVYAPKFYAGLGMSLALAGGILLAARVADAAIDPWLGLASDRTRRSRLFIAFALLPLTIGLVAMFNPPAGAPLAAWLIATVILVTLGFSAASIAFQAWGARLGDARERASVAAVREGFGLAGVVLASLLPQAFAASIESGLPAATWALAGLTVLCAAVTLVGAPDAVPARRTSTVMAGGAFRALHSRDFRLLLGVFALNGIASAIPATLFLFFVADVLETPSGSGAFLGLYFVSAAIALPLWVRMAARLGKRRAWGLAMALAVAAFGWAFFLQRGDSVAFAVICAASGAALGADLAIPPAMLADTIAQDGASGAEGSYFGPWNTVTKLNLALAAGLALPALEWTGYTSGAPATATYLPVAYCLIPCFLKLLAIAGLVRLRD
jgi:glycoside/pentoside/hexuronide:cation symporter, GPH family